MNDPTERRWREALGLPPEPDADTTEEPPAGPKVSIVSSAAPSTATHPKDDFSAEARKVLGLEGD